MPQACTCIADFNEQLAPEQELETSIAVSPGPKYSMFLATFTPLIRLSNKKRETRSGKPRLASHQFCPFCGISLRGELVRIYSGEHGTYWGAKGEGYTIRANEAGVFTLADAIALTGHCGPEKRIELEPVTAIKVSAPKEVQANG